VSPPGVEVNRVRAEPDHLAAAEAVATGDIDDGF
jgi:hypothetical protein